MQQRKPRPGIYRTVSSRDRVIIIDTRHPNEEDEPETTTIMLLKDSSGKLLKTSDGYYLAVKN